MNIYCLKMSGRIMKCVILLSLKIIWRWSDVFFKITILDYVHILSLFKPLYLRILSISPMMDEVQNKSFKNFISFCLLYALSLINIWNACFSGCI